MELRNLLKQMMDEGYVVWEEPHYNFTEKFYAGIIGEVMFNQPRALPVGFPDNASGMNQFITFIDRAKVPSRLQSPGGAPYAANKYNLKADRIFLKAIVIDKLNYDILLKSVQLYYASSLGYKKAIGNYFIDGDWLTGYQEMKEKIEGGDPQELETHIQKQLEDGEYGQYSQLG